MNWQQLWPSLHIDCPRLDASYCVLDVQYHDCVCSCTVFAQALRESLLRAIQNYAAIVAGGNVAVEFVDTGRNEICKFSSFFLFFLRSFMYICFSFLSVK